jgi:hypothetical protein
MKKLIEWPDFYSQTAEFLVRTCNTTSSWTKGQTERSMNGYLSGFLLGPLFFIHKQSCTLDIAAHTLDTSVQASLIKTSAFQDVSKPYD